jgi:hypothetical protein
MTLEFLLAAYISNYVPHPIICNVGEIKCHLLANKNKMMEGVWGEVVSLSSLDVFVTYYIKIVLMNC